MRKIILPIISACLCAMLLVLPISGIASGDLSEYGQVTKSIYYTANAPVADGIISNGEYGEPLHTLIYDPSDKSQYWNGIEETENFKLKDVILEEAVLYLTFDEEYLYVAAEVTDGDHCTPGENADVWDGDYLEFDFGIDDSGTYDGMLNSRHRIAFGISNAGNDYAYNATVPEYAVFGGYNKDAELPSPYCVTRDNVTKKTVYEAALKWDSLTGLRGVPKNAFFMFQFGTADSEYIELSDYNAYLGVFRYACRIPEGVIDDSARLGLHCLDVAVEQLPDYAESSDETTADTTVDTTVDTTSETTADTTSETTSETVADITANTTTDSDASTSDVATASISTSDGCFSMVSGGTMAVSAVMSISLVFATKKKKED